MFSDGARFRTHTVLSHFGCVGRVVMPDDQDVIAPAPSTGCAGDLDDDRRHRAGGAVEHDGVLDVDHDRDGGSGDVTS